MAGDALPPAILVNPSVRKPSDMIEELSLVGTLGVVHPSDDGSIAVWNDFHVSVRHQREGVIWVAIIGQELRPIHQPAIVIRADKRVPHQRIERLGIVVELCLVPCILQRYQLRLGVTGPVRTLRNRTQNNAKDKYRHDPGSHTLPPHVFRGVCIERLTLSIGDPEARMVLFLIFLDTYIRNRVYTPHMEPAFEIIAEPNRRAILSLLASSEQSVGEIERQLRMTQPTVSKHLRVLREAGFVESTVDAQRRLYRLKPEPLRELDSWLAQFRRFWSAHVDALERHLDRIHPSTPSKKKTRRSK